MAKKAKFYTVAGVSRVDGEVEPVTYDEVFKTRAEAAKFIAGEINEVLLNYRDADDSYDVPASVSAKDCKGGYRLSCYNDEDDIFDLAIVEHEIEPVHAVVTFDQDDRTVNITTFKTAKEARARVADSARKTLEILKNDIDHVYLDRQGYCEGSAGEIKKEEPFVQAETCSGNFTAWTAVEIPAIGTADIDVQ